ncbi:unnamed protein product [Dovyalis caffra]|uniref:Uncharacterized protein n=1 Tax=Dovyalis caffra TaxID=77055 RepID=A0AAV1S184_9ROSI|nr:unnamed protein product [Dovyalis caffra]
MGLNLIIDLSSYSLPRRPHLVIIPVKKHPMKLRSMGPLKAHLATSSQLVPLAPTYYSLAKHFLEWCKAIIVEVNAPLNE